MFLKGILNTKKTPKNRFNSSFWAFPCFYGSFVLNLSI